MAYEIFSRKVTRHIEPTLSITASGRLNLNKASAAILEERMADQVFLLWDSKRRKMALKPVTGEDPRVYLLRRKAKHAITFSVKTFLDHYGIRYQDETRSYPAIWNAKESLLEVDLPAEAVQPPQRPINR